MKAFGDIDLQDGIEDCTDYQFNPAMEECHVLSKNILLPSTIVIIKKTQVRGAPPSKKQLSILSGNHRHFKIYHTLQLEYLELSNGKTPAQVDCYLYQYTVNLLPNPQCDIWPEHCFACNDDFYRGEGFGSDGGSILNFGTFIGNYLVFRNNHAFYKGGAISNVGVFTCTHCEFYQNSAKGVNLYARGGAVYSHPGSINHFVHSKFFENEAYKGGAIASEEASLKIERTNFNQNRALISPENEICPTCTGLGGALYIHKNQGIDAPCSSSNELCVIRKNVFPALFINFCSFSNNTALQNVLGGGAIMVWETNSLSNVISNCVFENNLGFGEINHIDNYKATLDLINNQYGPDGPNLVCTTNNCIRNVQSSAHRTCIQMKQTNQTTLCTNWDDCTTEKFGVNCIFTGTTLITYQIKVDNGKCSKQAVTRNLEEETINQLPPEQQGRDDDLINQWISIAFCTVFESLN